MRVCHRLSLAFAVLIGSAPAILAQAGGTLVPTTASRAELEERARVADSLHKSDEAFVIRRRLRDGDFEVGDRVLLRLQETGEGVTIGRAAQDTLVVKAGRILPLADPMGDLNLTGVLFSELSDSVAARYSKYIKNIAARATPLVRLSTSGAVGRPGYYYLPPDSPLSDLMTLTGGQAANADMKKVEIHRGSETLWKTADVRAALTDGLTIEQLGLRPGDELNIGVSKQRGWLTPALQGLGLLLTLVVAVSQIH